MVATMTFPPPIHKVVEYFVYKILRTLFFNVEIINTGKDKTIGIGVAGSSYAHNRMPGWNKESYGYHADDGL